MNTNGNPDGKKRRPRGKGLPLRTFTTGQIAKICDVAPRTVSKWIDSGRIKGYRIPGSWDRRVTRENLIAFLKEHGLPFGDLAPDAPAETRVLFIGCTRETCDAIASHLTETEWQFRSAADGFAAGGLVFEWEPSIVVLDFALGSSVCLTMAGQFRASNADRRIVGLVGEDGGELSRTIRDHGFDRAFQAPFDFAAVAGAIRELSGEAA